MLTLWRRHELKCPHRRKGRAATKCACPIWCDGEVDGKRVRKSMKTRDWARALRNLGRIEDPMFGLRPCAQPGCAEMVERGRCPQHTREIGAAVASYHDAHQDVGEETKRYRERGLRALEDFLSGRGAKTVDAVSLDDLNAFRASRKISPRTWVRDLEVLRHFFRFCLDNEWIARNWAEKVPMPRNLKPSPREPYESNEIVKIIAACDAIGNSAYERLRARAMVLLLRYTALRISDVATLRKDRLREGEILLRTTTNGKPVKLPIHPQLQAALDVLPVPREADPSCPYLFWSGNGTRRTAIDTATRTLQAVFRVSGVAGACSHRFRHTLATEVLVMGGSIEDAADILGDSEAIVRKHYAKWSSGRQARITALLARMWHTKNSPPQVEENTALKWVPGVGLEPTLSLRKKGF
jgi:integrase